VLLIVASGGMTGFRSAAPAYETSVPYTAPAVTFTSWILPDTFGPQANTPTDFELMAAMQDTLTTVDDRLQVRPDLAQELPTPRNGGARIVGGNLVVT
jgi:hypothetical protein